VARTVSAAVRRVDDLRHGRMPAGRGEADPSSSVFLRGVALGALVGAAIAGSTIWERRLRRHSVPADDAPHPG
jgi:hypothetical protein